MSRTPSGQLGLPVCPLYLTCDVWPDCASVRRFSGELLRALSAPGSFKGAALMLDGGGFSWASAVSADALQANGRILSTSRDSFRFTRPESEPQITIVND